jgi:hypothetical protein
VAGKATLLNIVVQKQKHLFKTPNTRIQLAMNGHANIVTELSPRQLAVVFTKDHVRRKTPKLIM